MLFVSILFLFQLLYILHLYTEYRCFSMPKYLTNATFPCDSIISAVLDMIKIAFNF